MKNENKQKFNLEQFRDEIENELFASRSNILIYSLSVILNIIKNVQ